MTALFQTACQGGGARPGLRLRLTDHSFSCCGAEEFKVSSSGLSKYQSEVICLLLLMRFNPSGFPVPLAEGPDRGSALTGKKQRDSNSTIKFHPQPFKVNIQSSKTRSEPRLCQQ